MADGAPFKPSFSSRASTILSSSGLWNRRTTGWL